MVIEDKWAYCGWLVLNSSTYENVIEKTMRTKNDVGGRRGCWILLKVCRICRMYEILIFCRGLCPIDLSIGRNIRSSAKRRARNGSMWWEEYPYRTLGGHKYGVFLAGMRRLFVRWKYWLLFHDEVVAKHSSSMIVVPSCCVEQSQVK